MNFLKILTLIFCMNVTFCTVPKIYLMKGMAGIFGLYGMKKLNDQTKKPNDYKVSEAEIREIILIKDNY
ncbi:hypothetical protein M1446_04020 [Candidatus Dependentiae bacterium]|nr:hypothetical protein [Candidatus Dependentiae bacterium]